MNQSGKNIKLILCFLITVVFAASCQPVNLEKGEPLRENSRSFIDRELYQKSDYDGKRIQLIGYFDARWSQRGREVSLVLLQERGNFDSMILIIKLNEGFGKNEISLGKTGKSETVGVNQVRGSQMKREEFIVEDVRIYDNEGQPHEISARFGVSGTVEYMKDFWGKPKAFQDGFGNPHYPWELKDIRIDVEGK